MPARIAMTSPLLKELELISESLSPERVLCEPPIEHTTMPKITRTVPSNTNAFAANGIGGEKTSKGIIAPRPPINPIMVGYPRAIPSFSIPRPNRTAPTPQPIPNKASTARSCLGEATYTKKIFGTSRRTMIQFRKNMPSTRRWSRCAPTTTLSPSSWEERKFLAEGLPGAPAESREIAAYLSAQFPMTMLVDRSTAGSLACGRLRPELRWSNRMTR